LKTGAMKSHPHALNPDGLYGDWLWVDERIKAVSSEIEEISRSEENSANIMKFPGIGPLISTAIVAAIGKGEVFDRGREFAASVGLAPRQSVRLRTILGRISKRGNGYLRVSQYPQLALNLALILRHEHLLLPKFGRLKEMSRE